MQEGALRRGTVALALTLLLVSLWCLTHHYLGLGGDARLYAVQALARIHPNLSGDLYLRGTSQDSYTIFSDLYARCIDLLGLRSAALTLTLTFKVWFFVAAWALARRLSDARCAFLAVTLLILTACEYGAFSVFHYAEDWLTARSLAEALVATALACWFRGARLCGLLIACAAMIVHPLLALPGLLVMICLGLPLRLSILGAGAGILLSLLISLVALWRPFSTHLLAVMDASWLEIVRERSEFLFLQFWRPRDWSLNVQPILSLSLSALVLRDERIGRLCAASILIGTAGMAVALIASLIGPVALLLQGQAWRWMWVTNLVSIVLLAPTVLAMARAGTGCRSCALLMLSAWTSPTIIGTSCLAGALILWLSRSRLRPSIGTMLDRFAVILGLGLLGWGIRSLWTAASSGFPGSLGTAPALITRSTGLDFLYLAVVTALVYWLRATRSTLAVSLMMGMLLAASAYCLPRAMEARDREGSTEETNQFSDWRRVIPPNANVFVEPAHNSAGFAWFTLNRPSYLTVDQSSGVVFSRATALEVRRRSEVLLPLMDPDWMLLSGMHRTRTGSKTPAVRTLTRDRLISVCADPELEFVVAASNVGFGPLRHHGPGNRGEWYLYDCRVVLGTAAR